MYNRNMNNTFAMNEMTRSFRRPLVDAGFRELLTPSDVDQALGSRSGTVVIFVNSVCGCAAGTARPGVIEGVKGLSSPITLTTVFAGQEREATERARAYFPGVPPSSPSVVVLREGEPRFVLERRQIEGRSAEFVASEIRRALANV